MNDFDKKFKELSKWLDKNMKKLERKRKKLDKQKKEQEYWELVN